MDNHKLHPIVAQLAAAFVDDAGGLNIPAPARDVAAAAIAQLRGVEQEIVAIDLIALARKVVRLGVSGGGALGVLFVLAAELMGNEQATQEFEAAGLSREAAAAVGATTTATSFAARQAPTEGQAPGGLAAQLAFRGKK
jgi:hypothetical protein